MQRSIIKKWLTIIFLCLFLAYGLYKSYKIISGPIVNIETPKNWQEFDQNLIEVEGAVKNVAFMSLNGRPIFADKNGHFEERLLLLPGYNIISLKAEDRFKRQIEKKLNLYLSLDYLKNIKKEVPVSSATSTEEILDQKPE